MNLKDCISADNLDVFINLSEFSEYVELDNILIAAQVQYRTEEKSARQSESFEGLHGDFVKIFFRTADYCAKAERLPNQGEFIHVNGKLYKVLTCKDEMGITRLVASGYRQEQLRQSPFQRADDIDDNY